MSTVTYDPFAAGRFAVGTRLFPVPDPARERVLPGEIWYPEGQPGPLPLVVYSHPVAGTRRSATFLAEHLAGHGYAVAAVDHSEVVRQSLPLPPELTDEERLARVEVLAGDRVPDVRRLLDHLLGDTPSTMDIELDGGRIGLVGHSFGGWTVLATPEVDRRIGAVVALAPAGSANPLPGVMPLTLTLDWGRDVPTLFLAAEHDVPIPPDAVHDIYRRTSASKRMLVLRRADHQHFVDSVAADHETFRTMEFTGPAAWMPAAMRPIGELCPAEEAHAFTRGLTLAHLDATLRRDPDAESFMAGDVVAALAARDVDAYALDRR